MMNLLRNYQTAIIFVLVVACLYGGYVLFLAPSTEDALTVTATPLGPDQDLVALLFKLKEIRLDNALFADPLFQSLKDFGRDLVSEPIGRPNPFAPFDGAPIKPAK